MQIYIIAALAIAIIAVIFGLQNLAAVTISFFFWSIHGSLALVLLITLAAGVLLSFLVSQPSLIRAKWTNASQKKKLASLETERAAYQQKAETAEKEVKELEEQVASLSAALDSHTPDEK